MTRVGLVLIFTTSCLGAEQNARLTACDALTNRLHYNGQLVAIRGEVRAGGHGPYMIPEGACSYELITGGVAWPNKINLTYPNNRSPIETDHAPFSLDTRALRKADEYLERMGFRPGIDTEIATYVGLFVTYPDLDNRVSIGVPGAWRHGFGPAGMGAPAQLVIKTVEDVTIIKVGQDPHRLPPN